MRVLLTDDSRTIRMILRSLLGEFGIHDVVEAANGQQALDALNEGVFDLLLLDIHMPEIDGLGVLEKVKAPDSQNAAAPVVIISSDTDYRQIERARDLGAFGYIKKPFKKEGLEAAVRAARQVVEARGGTESGASPSTPSAQSNPGAAPSSSGPDTAEASRPKPGAHSASVYRRVPKSLGTIDSHISSKSPERGHGER